jgi:hypothetical protein
MHQQQIKFRIVNVKAFVSVIKIIKSFSDTVNMYIKQEGIEIVATDSMFYTLMMMMMIDSLIL